MKFSPEQFPAPAPEVKKQKPKGEMSDIEKAIDVSLIELLEAHAVRINEGTNGVIFRLNIQDVSPEVRDLLKEQNIDVGDGSQAIKVLKVYEPGIGRREFETQQKAYELVEAQSDASSFARVPKPRAFRDIAIGKETKQILSASGMKVDGDRMEMLLMDYVPGSDLATILYREVAKRHPKLTHIVSEADAMEFQELYEQVSLALGFAKPGGKSRDEGAVAYERNGVMQQNAKKLYDFLERTDFQLDGKLLDQIEHTMDLFHENGLCFRDGHHRNFMAAPAMPSKDAAQQAFVIDFGTATTFEGTFTDKLYEEDSPEGVKRYLDDYYVVKDLRRFTVPREERQQGEAAKYVAMLNGLQKRLQTREFWNVYEQSMLAAVDHGTFSASEAWMKCPPKPDQLENFLVLVMQIRSRNPEREPELRSYLQNRMAQASPVDRERLRRFLLAE